MKLLGLFSQKERLHIPKTKYADCLYTASRQSHNDDTSFRTISPYVSISRESSRSNQKCLVSYSLHLQVVSSLNLIWTSLTKAERLTYWVCSWREDTCWILTGKELYRLDARTKKSWYQVFPFLHFLVLSLVIQVLMRHIFCKPLEFLILDVDRKDHHGAPFRRLSSRC